jgi:hypothetical protein
VFACLGPTSDPSIQRQRTTRGYKCNGVWIERDFPHHGELLVPTVLAKAWTKCTAGTTLVALQPDSGRTRRDESGWYVTWCFADAETAQAFSAEFGGGG